MLQKILGTIEKEELMGAGELVVAGVSGGADSICLLSVLLELKEKLKIRVAAVHVHHGIRGAEADGDEEFVREFCEIRNVPLLVCHRNVPQMAEEEGLSEEEAGRKARYECFREAMEALSGDKLAVAHNRDDNAETVLFHLFRGSGLKGLSGMDYKAPLPFAFQNTVRQRDLPCDSIRSEKLVLVRPLLNISRKEIEAYLGERGISYCQDSTNRQEEYSRNRIRLNILPEACRVNEEAAANIVRAAGLLKETGRWMERQAEDWLETQALFEDGEARLPLETLEESEPVISGLIVRKALERLTGSLKDITKQHTDKILSLSEKGTGRRLSLPGKVTARNEYGVLVLSCGQTAERQKAGEVPSGTGEAECVLCPEEGWKEAEILGHKFRYRLFRREDEQKIPENRYTKWFACDKIKGNLSLRGRRPGDWFQAFSAGGRQTVKAYMINEKIPPDERGRIPLLTEGSHVLWIVGGRISEAYKVTEECKWVLEISVSGAQERENQKKRR